MSTIEEKVSVNPLGVVVLESYLKGYNHMEVAAKCVEIKRFARENKIDIKTAIQKIKRERKL